MGWNFGLPKATVRALSEISPDSKALHRELAVASVAFLVGSAIMLAILGCLIVRFVAPEGRWLDVLHSSLMVLVISVIVGGLGSAALSIWAMSRYHLWRGCYRCHFCGKAFKSLGASCDCQGAAHATKFPARLRVLRRAGKVSP